MDLENELLLVILLYLYVKLKSARTTQRIREETSTLRGHAYTQALLGRSDTQCQELMQISHEAYVLLCNHFKQRNWLQDGEQISVEEKIAMFLTMIGHNEQLRIVKQRFKHSRKTIFECFYEVLQGMIKFAIEEFKREVVAPTSSDATSNMSTRYKNLRELFSGAIGALDGTLIPAIVPANEEFLYKRRGGSRCYQNVLAVCDFNMIFTFVWAGWEGTVHDSRVLKEVVFNETANFPIPSPNNYYLCDAEYDNTRGFLAPYRNKRYRRANFRSACSTTKQKRFNHVHSQLRNVIERAFGVLKARFPILKQMIPLPFCKQRDVVIACFTIHNFIRRHNIHDQLFMECDENTELADEEQYGKSGEPRHGSHWDVQDMHYMFNLREEIANQLVANGSSWKLYRDCYVECYSSLVMYEVMNVVTFEFSH